MMESKFENSYLRTKEVWKEFYRYYFFKKSSFIASYVLSGIAFLMLLAAYIVTGEISKVTVFCIALILFLILFSVISYFSCVKIAFKRDKEVNKGMPVTVTLTVMDDCIVGKTDHNSTGEIEIAQLKKVILTKNLIILATQSNLCFLFKKDSFTKGSGEELLAFLKKKGLKF